MAGRKALPDAVKELTGTAQPCRMRPDAAKGLPDLPAPPPWLCDRGAEIFDGYVELLRSMKLASASDAAMLALLAQRSVEVEELTAALAEHGRTYETCGPSGVMYRTRPEVGQMRDAMRHVQTLLAEFGLSPAARSRVSAGKSEDDPDEEFAF